MDTTCKKPECGGTVVPTGGAGGRDSFATQLTGVCDKCEAIHRQSEVVGWFLTSGEG
jgi:hypothetical protein